ncbi:MAG: hypothetical protein KY469_10590 [Actinobacteria bacterium]|nr:hypothetical protein [Actinomycetota bacterium]
MSDVLGSLVGNVPFREFGQPVASDMAAVVADGLAMSGMTVEGRPAVAFQFRVQGEPRTPIVMFDLDGLVDLVAGCVAAAFKQDGYQRPDGETEVPYVKCPGCKRRLFGERADEGSCVPCAEAGDE